jgi:hypothetical protein
MQRGPVLEDLLALIRGQHIKSPEWCKFIRTDRYYVEMINDPGIGHLSKFVTRKLEDVAERFEQADEWDMVNITHQLPEWEKNDPGESSRPIPLEDILEAVGRHNDIQRIIAGGIRDTAAAEFFEPR